MANNNYVDVNLAISRVFCAFRRTIAGKNSSKECLCIPLDELSVDKNGEVWLNMKGWVDTKFEGQTHSLKQNLTRAQVERLPKGDNGKPLSPFLGTIKKPKDSALTPANAPAYANTGSNDNGDEPDLPF